MAATLKNAAVSSVNRGQPSSFYPADKPNPVFQALDQEIKLYVAFMKKRGTLGYRPAAEEASSRHSDTLFELWNKYEHRLPKTVFQSKLLKMGDFLVSIKEYNLALWQCYGRYLKSFGDVNVEETSDVQAFKEAFFPEGFDTEDAGFTFRALMGKSICTYQVIKMTDPKLQNAQSVDKSIQLLAFLRLVTQVILPKESLCWLVYNGTIHIYSISRHLMSMGHAAKVLEYLLWACMCMESSIPLLGVRYLTWRSTLYTGVCQCYYDCKAGQHAEAFARRAISKINELSQLENMSNNPESKDIEEAFRQATVRMAVMVYRRTVFETRRKPKGLLRPKTRANLKDAAQLPWPRTQSEKLLADMFEGSAAQFLCILETLNDSNRRTLLSAPPALDSEVELLDVFAELFMASQELIAGGGGNQSSNTPPAKLAANIKVPGMGGVAKEMAMIDMATKAEDGIPLSCVVKVVKLAYCYEQWDVLDAMLPNTLSAIKEVNEPRYGPDEKALEILQAYDKVVPRTKHRKLFTNPDEEDEGLLPEIMPTLPPPPSEKGAPRSGSSLQDDLIHLAENLLSVINGPFLQEEMDMDMVVDAVLILWSKCKAVFQKFQTGSTDNPKYLQKMENPSKWVYILDIVHQVLGWCGLSSVDPALTAEVVLRLSLVFEASAALEMSKEAKAKSDQRMSRGESAFTGSQSELSQAPSQKVESSHHSIFSATMLNQSVREQLLQAREILELGLANVSFARTVVALTDGKSIADVSWVKDLNKELFEPVQPKDPEDEIVPEPKVEQPEQPPVLAPGNTNASMATNQQEEEVSREMMREMQALEASGDATAVWNTVKDLHMELIFMYHRVCLKLADLGPDPSKTAPKPFKRKSGPGSMDYTSAKQLHTGFIETYEELVNLTKRNGLSRSLLYMQRALMTNQGGVATTQQRKLLEDAMSLIKKVENEERNLFTENTAPKEVQSDMESVTEKVVKKTKVPRSPHMLCRTDVGMVFRPADFNPSSGEKVAWYRIFARNAAGSNVKVRLNDYLLPGTGEQVPSFRCELYVQGLTPGDKYIFAVAAYTSEGKLIGNGIGESTKPVLASHPMPVLMSWAYLSQVAYQVGCYDIAQAACVVLWNYFVAEPPPPQHITYLTAAQKDFKLTLHKLNQKLVSQTSPVLLRMFLTSIFINVDITVKQGQLFCDTLCDKGPLLKGQTSRLVQCQKMLVAMELAGWLNESNLALQAVVQCYGLLAPMIHFKIPAIPIIQILERCCAILQEIPSHLRLKRTAAISESLHHLTACMTYHMAKVLRSWGQRALASNLNDTGRKLLAHDPINRELRASGAANTADSEGGPPGPEAAVNETGSLTLAALKKKKTLKKGAPSGKEDHYSTGNEELKALEAHMLRLSKQAQGEHELTGNEEPSILHAYIAYLPSRIAYKEVVKFKRRARYLEFFVQCTQKALAEGIADFALEWCEDTIQWLAKRNENIIGTKAAIGKQPGAMTIIGDDPKKFQAALIEYTKDRSPRGKPPGKQPPPPPPGKQGRGKKAKYKPIGVTNNMSDLQRQAQEELELKALDILSLYFIDCLNTKNRRRKLRKISTDEMPWRSQLNIVEGLSQFGVFLQKLETREKMMGGNATSYMYRTTFLEEEWFAFETAGTLVVNWSGGPSRQQTREGHHGNVEKGAGSDITAKEREILKTSGIEIAAAAATGAAPPPTYPIPQDEEDTPRTYRSDLPASPRHVPKAKPKAKTKGRHEEDANTMLLTREEGVEMLRRCFNYLKRAVVLAHRGQHWTLLQNACRALWNCAHTALMRAHSPDKHRESFLDVATLRALLWQPFYVAADCLLDMLILLQGQRETKKSKKKERQAELGPDGKPRIHSWMGGIKEEKGGASLKFESPLDDISLVDTRWLGRIVLRVLELLYYEQKWERLVDISLRFNALSDDRYAEQVNPLTVQAQRKLIQRIAQYDGKSPPQPHFQMATRGRGSGPITAKDYATLQLQIHLKDEELSEIDPGAHIDPEGHDAYSGGLHALRLCCVPLDVSHTLQNLRGALDQSQYTARALQHSRRLLILYLAGQTSASPAEPSTAALQSRASSKVDFVPNTARPQPTAPPDLSREEFLSRDDVQTAPLPRGQVGVVMTSYDKTIELLLAGNQRGLAAEAMRELGNLHYHSGNIRGAYKWWAEALDLLLQTPDAIHQWRGSFQGVEDPSAALLAKCGLWGCLLGGVICSNIAQYILTSDLGLRIECCFLSGYFFKALFRSSLPHPTADRDYALYEVGEGCEVTNLVPGVDLLSERFRSDGRSLVAALRFVMDELHRSRHNLFVLPILTLYLFFTTFVCRDLQRTVDGRILKVRVLTDLGFHMEALITLQRLLHGERLPHSADSNFRQVESKAGTTKFNTQKPILEPMNLKVLESVLDKRLSSNLGTLYGPHLTCHLTISQAQLLVSLAQTIPVLPKFEENPPGSSMHVQAGTMSTASHGVDRKGSIKPQVTTTGAATTGTKASPQPKAPPQPKPESEQESANTVSDEEDSAMTRGAQRFMAGKKAASLEQVKGTLLAMADQMLSTVSEIIIENAQHDKGVELMNAAELELVVQAKLQLAAIAQQRHHSAMASRIVFSALKILQGSNLFKDRQAGPSMTPRKYSSMKTEHQPSRNTSPVKLVDGKSSQYQYQNFQSRSRLDARTWLQCRYALVKSMVGELRGMGQVKGPERKVKVELADVRQYCAEGINEADACGETEMQAEFLFQGALLNMLDGRPVEETRAMLQDLLELLGHVPQLSSQGQLTHALTLVHLTDLQAAECGEGSEDGAILAYSLQQYTKAQGLLLAQLEKLGEITEHRYDGQQEFSTPEAPLRNLYLPHLLPLVQVKLRIGHAMARMAAKTARDKSPEEAANEWARPLGVLTTALEICKVITVRIASVEAEILLNMGKVQRQLSHLGRYNPRAAGQTLVEAIRTTYNNDHDLGLMRQAYLELAVLYLASSGAVYLKEGSMLEVVTSEDESVASSKEGTKVGKRKKKAKKTWKDETIFERERSTQSRQAASKREKTRDRTKSMLPESDGDLERRAAWIAVRCAAAVGQAMRARTLLAGDATITASGMGTKAQQEMPDFLMLDLVGSYILGERKRIYKNEIEEELAPLTEALEPPPVETYDDQLNKAREAAGDLSWIHIIGYQALLQRHCSTAALSSQPDPDKVADDEHGDLGPGFDLGFISHAQNDISPNHDVVRSILFAVPWALRLNYVHSFLSQCLPAYANDCSAIFPPSKLQLPLPDSPDAIICNVDLIVKSYSSNLSVPLDVKPDGTQMDLPSAPGTQENLYKPNDKRIVDPKDNELCFQWYQPSLDNHIITQQEEGLSEGNLKQEKQVMLLHAIHRKPDLRPTAMMWVGLNKLIDLHDRLTVLTHRGEISLPDKDKKKDAAKGRKVARIKALSPKHRRDDQLESLLRQCMAEAQTLFGFIPELEETELPSGRSEEAYTSKAGSPSKTGDMSEDNQPEIPFDVSKPNVYALEGLFDPSFGFCLKDTKMLAWFIQFFSPP